MEDLEILPKRRKLVPPVEQPNGYKEEINSPLNNASTVQETKNRNKINHHKEIQWNFKLVRPEVLKCCQRIVKGLKSAEPASEKSCSENGTAQQNGLTPPREKEKECTFAPKRKLNSERVKQDKITTATADALPTKCSEVVTISRENSGSSKEKNSGYTVNSQAPTQQHLLERSIPSSLTKEKVQNEIRKIIKEHTREAMDKAESLKSRISTLESENRWLKHKVTIFYSAVKKALAHRKQKEVLPTKAKKPQVKPDLGCLESLLQPQPVSVAAIKDKPKDEAFQAFQTTVTTATNNSLPSGSEAVEKISVKSTPSLAQMRAPHNTTTPSSDENKIRNNQTTRSAGTGPHSPIVSLIKKETLSSVQPQNQFPVFSKTPQAFGLSKKTTLDNGIFSSVSAPQHKVTTSFSNGYTTKSTASPISLLCQVLDEILATSKHDLPDQFTLNQQSGLQVPKNFREPLPCTTTGISLHGTIPNGSEEFLHKQSSPPLKRKITMNLLNTLNEKPLQGATNTLLDRHRAEQLSPIAPDREASEAESKKGEFLENSCNLENDGQKKTSPLINKGAAYYKCHTETHLPNFQVQSNVALPAATSCTVSSISQPAKSVPVTSSECPSVLGSYGQSIGLLDGMDMLAQAAGLANTSTDAVLAQAAGLANTSTDAVLRPERSSKKHTSLLDEKRAVEGIKILNQDLRQHGLKNHAVEMAKIASEACCSKSQSSPSPGIAISLNDEPQKHSHAAKQHVSTNGSLQNDCTGVVSKHVHGHHNATNTKEKQFDKTQLLKPHMNVNDLPFQHEGRPISHIQEENSGLVTKGFSNCDPRVAVISPNKFHTVTYHAKPQEGHNMPSTPRFYNRECQDHTLGQPENSTCVRAHIVSKPRYLPYLPIRPKVQQTPLISVSSNIQYVSKMNARHSPKPGMPRSTPPLIADTRSSQNSPCLLSSRWPEIEEKSTKSSNEERIYQPPRFLLSPETSSSKVRLTSPCSANSNTSASYNKESLLLQLLPSDRAPFIPHNSASTYRVTQDLSNVQTMNAVDLRSKSLEASNRYVYLSPKRLVQNNTQNPRESWICNSGQTESEAIALHGKPPLSVGEGHRDSSWQTPVCSFNSVSFHTNSALNPQIELSHSCQRYLTQLRKSPLQFPHDNSIYSTAKLIPQSESVGIDRNNSSKQTLKFPISYSSIKRQAPRQQEGYDAQQVNPQVPTTQSKKENSFGPQHQKSTRVLYHHKKFTNPQQRQQEHLAEEQSNSSITQQMPQEIKSGLGSKLEMMGKRRQPSMAVNDELQKQK